MYMLGELVWEFLTCEILSSWIWYKKLWSLSKNDAMVHGSWPAHRVSEKRMMHLRRSSWVSVQFLWAQDGLIWGEFSFYRGVHTSCWSVSQVNLIGGAWLLLALVTPMKAVRVYWDRRLLTTFHKCVHVSLGFLQQQYQDVMWARWPFSNALCCLCGGQMKGCIKVLKEQPSNSVEGLLNALRWVWM